MGSKKNNINSLNKSKKSNSPTLTGNNFHIATNQNLCSDCYDDEVKICESESKYKTLFESSADAILIIEGDRFIDCNTATVDMLGYESKQHFLNTHPSELSPKYQPDGTKSLDKANKILSTAYKIGSQRFEWDHRRENGDVFPVEVLMTPFSFKQKSYLQIVWRDITERKRLELLENRAARLESAGLIAGQVAHDFNNLLVPLISYPALIRDELSRNHPCNALIDQLENSAKKLSEINQDLLTLSRRGSFNTEKLSLNEIIETALNDVKLDSSLILVDTKLDSSLKQMDGGNCQIYRMVINLIHNSIDAMDHKGKISISTSNFLNAGISKQHNKLVKRDYVILEVSDTGCGISREVLPKIFDPFFTTKKTDKKSGSGLGMTVIKSVIEDHKGYIEVESSLNRGTTFTVYFPVSQP